MGIIQQSYYKKYSYSLRSALGVLYISDPIGWNEDNKIFKRSTESHGMFINLSNKLEFYVGDDLNDGGYNYLKEVYKTYGINAVVLLVKEENVSGILKEVYRGYFDFSTYNSDNNKISIMFNESGLYEKIKARNTEELEVDRLTTMDGGVLEELKTEILSLEGRKILIIDELVVSTSEPAVNIALNSNDGDIYIDKKSSFVGLKFRKNVDYSSAVIPIKMTAEQDGNIQTIYDYNCPSSDSGWGLGNASSTAAMFYDEAENAKTLKIDFDIEFKRVGPDTPSEVRIELAKYGGVLGLEYVSVETLVSSLSPAENEYITFKAKDYEVPVLAGESLSLIIHCRETGTEVIWFEFTKVNVSIYDETYSEPSLAKFVMPFEALDRIINIITNEPKRLKSNALGRTDIGYNQDGIASLNGLTNGFWVREFNTSKITTSFQDFVDSYKSTWQLSYGIEKIGFDEIIRMEHISHFYQNVVTIKLKDNPGIINRKCAKDYFYSSVEIGYSQPSGTILYEEVLGLDEYNIKNNFTTAITRIQNKFTSVSKYRADSYGTEFARRKPKAKFPEEDTRYDLSVMILDLKRGIGNIFQQRKWSDDFIVPTPFNKFTTGIYSPETATNLRLSPMNTLLRWGFWLKGGFMKNLSEYVRYSSSNGNSSLITEINEVGGVPRAENGNVLNSDLDKNLYNPEIISFEYPITNEIMKSVTGTTIVDGETIMNYYGLVEFLNEDGDYEYGFLLNLEPNGNGKIELLSSTKRISKVSSNTLETSVMIAPNSLKALNENLNEVILTWVKAEAQEGISHYRIYMDDKLVGNTISNITNYTVKNVTEIYEHSFYVVGVTNKCRVTKNSNTVNIILPTIQTSNDLDFNLNKYL